MLLRKINGFLQRYPWTIGAIDYLIGLILIVLGETLVFWWYDETEEKPPVSTPGSDRS